MARWALILCNYIFIINSRNNAAADFPSQLPIQGFDEDNEIDIESYVNSILY